MAALTISEVRAWRPAQLDLDAERLTAQRKGFEGVVTDLNLAKRAMADAWQGDASEAATAKLAAWVTTGDEMHASLSHAIAAIREAAAVLQEAQAALVRAVTAATEAGCGVEDDGTVTPPPVPAPVHAAILAPSGIRRLSLQHLAAVEGAAELAASHGRAVHAALEDARAADSRCAASLDACALTEQLEAMSFTSVAVSGEVKAASPFGDRSAVELFSDIGRPGSHVTMTDVVHRGTEEALVGTAGGLTALGQFVWRRMSSQDPRTDFAHHEAIDTYYRWTGKNLGVTGREAVTATGEIVGPLLIPVPGAGAGDLAALGARADSISARVLAIFRRPALPELLPRGSLADGAVKARGLWPPDRYRVTQFEGNRVYQRDDLIDPFRSDRRGQSNLELMRSGRALYGPDGRKVELHHLTQRRDGAIVEITGSMHAGKETAKVLHINQPPSDFPSGINRNEFKKWRSLYWKQRFEQMTGRAG